MATRSSRKSTVTHSTQQTSQVSEASSSTTSERPGTPISPTKVSRLEEKAQLQNLNDRLATYIERVRQLETENSRLTVQIQSSQEYINREISTHKSLYEKELSEARRVLDETAKEKARLQIEANKWKTELDELKIRLNKKEKELSTLEKRVNNLENSNQDLHNRLSQAINDKKKVEEQLAEALDEADKLAKQLETAKKQLERETLLRVEQENKVLSLQEELAFRENVHEKELSESRYLSQTEVTELDGRLKEHYEQQMADNLRELRDSYEAQMRCNREELDRLYQTKISDLQQQLEDLGALREEVHSHRSKSESLEAKTRDLEAYNDGLLRRIKDLERLLEQERDWNRAATRDKDAEIRKLKDQLNQQLKDFQDLLDAKVALTSELAVYEKLLEGEESRLNLSMNKSSKDGKSSQQQRGPPLRGKRRRTYHTEEEESSKDVVSTKGELEISDQDPEGRFVKIHNKGSTDRPLAGYQIVREATATGESLQYRFPRTATVKAGATITIWSGDSGTTHNPAAGDLVMKSTLKWPAGPEVSSILLTPSGEEVASRTTAKRSHSSVSDHTSSSERVIIPPQANGEDSQERCSIM